MGCGVGGRTGALPSSGIDARPTNNLASTFCHWVIGLLSRGWEER